MVKTKDSRINIRIAAEKREWFRTYAERNETTMSAIIDKFINTLIRREGGKGR